MISLFIFFMLVLLVEYIFLAPSMVYILVEKLSPLPGFEPPRYKADMLPTELSWLWCSHKI